MGVQGVYQIAMNDWSDVRTSNRFWIDTPFPLLAILFCYFCFVGYVPKYMKNRKPFKIVWLITAYNLVQIYWNVYLLYLVVKAVMNVKEFNFSISCIPVKSGIQEIDEMMVTTSILYYYNKIFDLLDTVFFVLRKKQNQVTFFHVYHHVSMTFTMWLFAKYSPGGNCMSGGTLNAVVHVVMYAYYQVALLKWGKPAIWKKYITQLQLVQLIVIIFHNGVILVNNSCKNYPIMNSLLLFQCSYIVYHFLKFYVQSYLHKRPKRV